MEDIVSTVVQPTMILAIVLPVGLVLSILIGMVILQRRKITQLQEAVRPKYGFLGKPLYSLMAIAILAGGFGFSVFTNQSNTDIVDTGATRAVKAIVYVETLEARGAEYLVSFKVTPVVNDKEWGIPTDEYDAFWKVTGPEEFSEVELTLSLEEPSGFTKLIAPGNYEIVVDLFGTQDSAQTRVAVTIP